MVERSQKGLRFKLPADWPIEERNGVVAPVPVEEYLSKKFSQFGARLAAIEARLELLEKRSAKLEEEFQKEKASKPAP